MVAVTGLDDLRTWATALPGVVEVPHFRLPSFTVGGKRFVVLAKDGGTVLLSVGLETAEAAAVDAPDRFEVVLRRSSNGGTVLVGLRVDLAAVPAEQVRDLVGQAWQNTAPTRLRASSVPNAP
jgi:hypothetical protein